MIQRYREMVDDPLRLAAFRRAIADAVRGGRSAADIGCGLGTYAVFAAQAGSERVIAVDDGPVIEVAREIVRANGCSERVRVLAGRSTEVEPGERVDVAIFEDYVAGLLTPSIVEVLKDLRARWLAPGGTLLPARARVFAAPVELREVHQGLDRFAALAERVEGVDLGAARRRAVAAPHAIAAPARALLTQPLLLEEIELATVDVARVTGRGSAAATRTAVVHGVLVWFALELPPAWLSTGPLDPASAWRQLFLPFDRPLPVEAGAPLEIEVDAAPLGDALVWRWSVSAPDARASAHSLDGLALSAEALRGGRPDLVPVRSEDLELDLAILEAVDGKRDQAAITALVQARFPARFASASDAARRVARVLGRYRAASP